MPGVNALLLGTLLRSRLVPVMVSDSSQAPLMPPSPQIFGGITGLPHTRRAPGQAAAGLARRDTRPGPPQGPAVSAQAAGSAVPMAVFRRCGVHRTLRMGRIAAAPTMAQSPATVYSTP